MKRLLNCAIITCGAALIFSCNTLKTVQTNTTGGLFNLNGTWRLSSTTDSTSMVGTTISVFPVVTAARVKSTQNNRYCVRENDQLWKNIKSSDAGGFTLSALVNACNGTPAYNDGTIAIVDNNKITVTTRTATNSELIQAWDRVK